MPHVACSKHVRDCAHVHARTQQHNTCPETPYVNSCHAWADADAQVSSYPPSWPSLVKLLCLKHSMVVSESCSEALHAHK